MTKLDFAVNQRRFSFGDGAAEIDSSLLEFLRKEGFTGCKQVCGEGGCGACTAVLSFWDPETNSTKHQSVATCLLPLPFVHHMHITTIEGLSKLSDGELHPVSEAFYEMGASQCGFCTPGFIMSFAARLAQDGKPEKAELENIFDGNLCRCTGYRPIMDAAAVFCADALENPKCEEKLKRWRDRLERCRSLDEFFPDEFKASQSNLFQGRECSWPSRRPPKMSWT